MLHWRACQSLMRLRLFVAAHEGSRRRGAGNLFLLTPSFSPSLSCSHFPLSPHLDSRLLLYLVGFRHGTFLFCVFHSFSSRFVSPAVYQFKEARVKRATRLFSEKVERGHVAEVIWNLFFVCISFDMTNFLVQKFAIFPCKKIDKWSFPTDDRVWHAV